MARLLCRPVPAQPPRRASSRASPRLKCANCSSSLRPTHRFCPNCGAPVSGVQQPTPAQPAAVQSGPSLQVLADPTIDLSENRRLVTVMFADLSGSTPLGERLDPEDLRRILGSFFSALAREIQRFGGTIDKFIGDAVMAVFGAPVAHEDDAERAVGAAIAMQAAIGQLNDELERRHGVRLFLRIGINTGEVVAGLLASDVQGAYTVVGDAVNTAQRFESAAPLGGILVSETTWRQTRQTFEYEAPTEVTLKGKAEPQPAHRVLSRREGTLDAPSTPLVGRDGELARLRRLLADAVDGHGARVHIGGEAGVGKSRLLREFTSDLDQSVTVFASRCLSFETDTPYAVIGHLMRFIFAIRGGADRQAAQASIERGFALLGESIDPRESLLLLDILGYGEHSGLDPQSRQRVLVSLLRRLLRRWSDHTALLIVTEDLHWIDSASSAVLVKVAGDVEAHGSLLLTTSRPGWTPPWPAETIVLESLIDTNARAMVELAFGRPVDDTLIEMVLGRTGGNPFFIEEVVRDLRESEVLVEQDGRIAVQEGVTPQVPATVQEVLTARLDRLPPSAKRVLQPAAVCGRVFWQRVIEKVVPGAPVTESIATLEREQFVIPRPTVGEPIYVFRHALIQEVAYRTQLQSQRRVTHGAIGAAIETLFSERIEEYVNHLAFHYGHSDNDPKALQWLVRAGDRAKALFANQEALALYASALERARDGDGPHDAGSLLERAGDIQSLIGRYDEAIDSFQSARARIPNLTALTSARLQRKIGAALRIKGAYAEAISAFESALATIGDRIDVEVARIQLELGQLQWRTGQNAAARNALQVAVNTAIALEDDAVVAEGLQQLGNIPLHAGDPREAVELFRRSRSIYERREDISGIAMVRLNLGVAYGRLGNWDECLSELTAAGALFERIGDQWHLGMVHNNIGQLHRGRGQYSDAIAAYQRSIAISTEVGYSAGVANGLMGLGTSRLESGDFQRGREDLLEAQRRFAALGQSMYLPEIHRSLAVAELQAGNVGAAASEAERSLELARAGNAPRREAMAQRVLAQVAIARGQIANARALLEASHQIFSELGEAAELTRTETLLRELPSD